MSDYDPDMTLVQRDKRKTPYTNNKMMNPMVTWAMIGTILSATITGTIHITDLKAYGEQTRQTALAQHLTSMDAIEHESDMRIIVSGNTEDAVDEVQEDIRELKEEMKEQADETQELLRQLLQKD